MKEMKKPLMATLIFALLIVGVQAVAIVRANPYVELGKTQPPPGAKPANVTVFFPIK